MTPATVGLIEKGLLLLGKLLLVARVCLIWKLMGYTHDIFDLYFYTNLCYILLIYLTNSSSFFLAFTDRNPEQINTTK